MSNMGVGEFPSEPRPQSSQFPVGLTGTEQAAGDFSLGLPPLLLCCAEFLSEETVPAKEPNETTLTTAGHCRHSPQTHLR